jgi:hypothetical protein
MRFKPAAADGDKPAADGLDDDMWHRVVDLVLAASKGNPRRFTALAQWGNVPLGRQHRGALYVRYMLRYRLAEIVGHRPIGEDMHELAETAYPRYARVLNRDRDFLEDTLREIYDIETLGASIDPAPLVLSSAVALAVLLDRPEHQMAAMRPALAKWYAENYESLKRIDRFKG